MIRAFLKQLLSITLSFLLVINAVPFGAEGQQPAQAAPAEQAAPLSGDQLQQLVAPIALYPDALVAQTLGAATFPDQVATASNFLQVNKSLTGSTLMQAVDKEPWDPSVKALTQFPSVLDNLAKNLSWASALGEAYHTQPADVMSAVQTLRAKAYAAGNLKSGSQITVVQESPQVIVIQPANPQVVYVPQYNPTVVYGTPYATPGYSTAAVVTTGLLAFGAGIAVGAAMNNSCCGWGYSYWNTNWHGGTVYYRGGAYYGNNAWHGGYYGSSATAYGPYGTTKVSSGYNPSTGTYARGGTVSNSYGSRSAGQAYNPSTGTYARGASASTPTEAQRLAKLTTQIPELTPRHIKPPTPTGTTEARSPPRTATLRTPSIKRPRKGLWEQYRLRRAPKALPRRVRMAIALPLGELRMATSMRRAANGNVYKNTGSGWTTNPGNQPEIDLELLGSQLCCCSRLRRAGKEQRIIGLWRRRGWQSRQASARGSTSRGGGRAVEVAGETSS